MTYSLNEVEALVKKATRGAGYEWGVAEESAKAIRWLCSHKIDGCEALVGLLSTIDKRALQELRPNVGGVEWKSEVGGLCPLYTGTALSDFAFRIERDAIALRGVLHPVILLPFVASVARQTQSTVSIRFCECTVLTDGVHVGMEGELESLKAPKAEVVKVQKGGEIITELSSVLRAPLDEAVRAKLEHFAHRTYAPATESSRQLGAGAGSTREE